MNCLIILNGEKTNIEEIAEIIAESNCVICADGGAKWAHESGIPINAIIGDFDSLSEDIIKLYELTETRIIKSPIEKDETDGVLAVDYALREGAKNVTILGASGGRMDHQYGNIMLLKRLQDAECKGKMMLENGYAFMSNEDVKIICSVGEIVSIVPFGGELIISKTSGLKYKIEKDTYFCYDYPIGISNVAIENNVGISIAKGNALVFCYKAN